MSYMKQTLLLILQTPIFFCFQSFHYLHLLKRTIKEFRQLNVLFFCCCCYCAPANTAVVPEMPLLQFSRTNRYPVERKQHIYIDVYINGHKIDGKKNTISVKNMKKTKGKQK